MNKRWLGVVGLLVVALVAAVLAPRARAQESYSSPTWPHLVASAPPDAWRVEGAGRGRRWKGAARVTEVDDAAVTGAEARARVAKVGAPVGGDDAPASRRTFVRFVAGEATLLVAVPALPKEGALARALEAGLEVDVTLVETRGFEGEARGLLVREAGPAGRLLLAFDDGGYGAALGPSDRDDTTLTRAPIERVAGGGWQPVPVSFQRGNDAVTLTEGQAAALGRSGLAATLVLSRAWGGGQVTDADLTPCSWLLHRIKGS